MTAIPDSLCLGMRASGKSSPEQLRSPAGYLSRMFRSPCAGPIGPPPPLSGPWPARPGVVSIPVGATELAGG